MLVLLASAAWAVTGNLAGCREKETKSAHPQAQSAPTSQAVEPSRPIKAVREAAVAGLFYPKDEKTLSTLLDGYLAKADKQEVENLCGLVCPHAGYEFSGPLAAGEYKLLVGRDIHTVFILAPSHYADFTGAYISPADAYRTPLGLVPISTKAEALAKISPFISKGEYRVQRPDWSRLSPQAAPPAGQDQPDTWEHAGEVQVPFLQKTVSNFTIIPVVFGQVDPAAVAAAMAPFVDDQTLVVASSDLSHFLTDQQARALDDRCLTAICAMDFEAMQKQEACGKGPILALMHLAKLKGWKPRFLGYCNSGDATGDKNRVVGYGAVAFYQPTAAVSPNYTPQERKQLLELARKALREVVIQKETLTVDEKALSAKLTSNKGCFVTLTKGGELRGCIGNIAPQQSLYRAVIENAKNAALRDPRFSPVREDELDKIEIEISVLTVPEPLFFKTPQELLERLRPHTDGVILKMGERSATFLPQVWEQLPDKEAFLNALAEKAGCRRDAWKNPSTAVFTYQVEAFKESEK